MRKLQNDELNRLSVEEFKSATKHPIVIVLDNVRSLYNVGSVFRTADAFLCDSIYLCGITACPPNKEIYKTALGAEESVAWHYFEHTADALLQLREQGYQIIAIEQVERSAELQNFLFDPALRYAFVFGHEVKGVDEQAIGLCHACIEIPQFGTKHSLNISVSVGVVLWEYARKMATKPISE
jgi:23S rRNA (guanosine2251-2'-O)-methyltransferase